MKIIKWILGIIVALALIGCVTFFVDKGRVNDGKAPKFAIKKVSADDKKIVYTGLGYKVISYVKKDKNEDFKEHDSKIGSWFMNYELKEDGKIENKEEKKEINSVKDFYEYIKKESKELEQAKKDFSAKDAKEQDYYVITKENKNYNEEKLNEFFEKYKEEKMATLRVAFENENEKIYIYDILFEPVSKKVLVAVDKSRDDKLDEKETKIKLEKYDKIEKIEKDDKKELVVFEGSEYDKNASSKKSMIIGEIK